jgi:peptidoglycan hydrolase CwlO-like protein
MMRDRLQEIKKDVSMWKHWAKNTHGAELDLEELGHFDWLISEIEAQSDALKWAKGEIDEMEAEIEQLKADINIMENEYMHGLKYENKRLREVLKWIVGHSIDYQAIDKARQALKGGGSE